jgi:hypothetical protein
MSWGEICSRTTSPNGDRWLPPVFFNLETSNKIIHISKPKVTRARRYLTQFPQLPKLTRLQYGSSCIFTRVCLRCSCRSASGATHKLRCPREITAHALPTTNINFRAISTNSCIALPSDHNQATSPFPARSKDLASCATKVHYFRLLAVYF